MKMIDAPENLTAVVLILWDGETYTLELAEMNDLSALPLEHRIMAKALHDLADQVAERGHTRGVDP